jgi:maleate cis-trans isomerase
MTTAAERYASTERFGIIIPSVNTVLEPEFWSARPEGTTFHFARAGLRVGSDEAGLDLLRRAAPQAARDLGDAEPSLVVFACTSGSMVTGGTTKEELEAELTREAGVRALTTASAVVDALRSLGVKRVGLGTPYLPWVGAAEVEFFSSNGFEVVANDNLGITDGHEMAALEPSVVADLARRVDRPIADAIFLSCTDLPTFSQLGALEAELGKPVVSSNSATLWSMLGRRPGLEHLGTLFDPDRKELV